MPCLNDMGQANIISQGNGMPGVPGLFIEEQKAGWKKIADAIHAAGGYAYLQLWLEQHWRM